MSSSDRWKTAAALPRPPQWWKSAGADSWWQKGQFPTFGERYETSAEAWIGLAKLKESFEGGPPLRQLSWEGNLVVPEGSLFDSIQAILSLKLIRVTDHGNGNGHFIFASEETMVNVHTSEKGTFISIRLGTFSEKVVLTSTQLFNRCVIPDDPRKGLVFTLVRGMGGFSINRLGLAGTPLIRDNYIPEVLSAYDHVVEDLNTESPCGRLIILSGSPGTGKTFLVRSLLSAVPNAAFILIPPNLMTELSGPEILPALTQAKNEFNGPIILIIEDADQCLVNRKEGDMSAISSMLNLGDGILGSILDVRILATTNAKTLEMDEATRRPGRLCRYIEVGPLDKGTAQACLSRLMGRTVQMDKGMSLAEVYRKARGLGWKPPPKEPTKPTLRKEIL